MAPGLVEDKLVGEERVQYALGLQIEIRETHAHDTAWFIVDGREVEQLAASNDGPCFVSVYGDCCSDIDERRFDRIEASALRV